MRTQAPRNPHAPDYRAAAGQAAAAAPPAGRVAPSRLFTADDVAAVLGVPRHFVYTLARRGELPTVRVGERYVRFRAEAIAQWIADQESNTPRYLR